jgi:hypothetical protein
MQESSDIGISQRTLPLRSFNQDGCLLSYGYPGCMLSVRLFNQIVRGSVQVESSRERWQLIKNSHIEGWEDEYIVLLLKMNKSFMFSAQSVEQPPPFNRVTLGSHVLRGSQKSREKVNSNQSVGVHVNVSPTTIRPHHLFKTLHTHRLPQNGQNCCFLRRYVLNTLQSCYTTHVCQL